MLQLSVEVWIFEEGELSPSPMANTFHASICEENAVDKEKWKGTISLKTIHVLLLVHFKFCIKTGTSKLPLPLLNR